MHYFTAAEQTSEAKFSEFFLKIVKTSART